MKYFNAVLSPPHELAEQLISLCEKQLASISLNYCLSTQVLPHITLCQYKSVAPYPFDVEAPSHIPTLEKLNVRAGDGMHEGYKWLELPVTKNEWISDIQKTVFEILSQADDIETLTKTGNDYYPHLTLCRTNEENLDKIALPHIPKEIFENKNPWVFKTGTSDINGQFFG